MRLRLHTTLTATAAAAALLVTTPLAVPPASAVSPSTQAHRDHRDHRDHRGGHDQHAVPTLEQRATLSADYLAEGPPSGTEVTPANGRTGPFDGQVIPGFSAMVENRDGTFWAMPDNGFGNKQNSADFLLRLYRVDPAWETKRGGKGEMEVEEFIQLSDPDGHVDFPIINEDTEDRLLTGNDFDIESLVKAKDGTFWIGEEFGPFLLHVDSDGKLVESPIPLPDQRPDGEGELKSPQNQTLTGGEEPLIAPSKGFEAMAVSSSASSSA